MAEQFVVTEERTDLAIQEPQRMEENQNFVVELTASRELSYSSVKSYNINEKMKFFNAVNSPEFRIKNCVNMRLWIKDVYVETVKCKNDKTGEIKVCPRIVLIDVEGRGYTCVSTGVFSGLKKIFQMVGEPTWESPIPFIPKLIDKDLYSILTIIIDTDAYDTKNKNVDNVVADASIKEGRKK